jgi:hypothetical protein
VTWRSGRGFPADGSEHESPCGRRPPAGNGRRGIGARF